jgi:pimeloyl-ACP methyl ester carboxylesterase
LGIVCLLCHAELDSASVFSSARSLLLEIKILSITRKEVLIGYFCRDIRFVGFYQNLNQERTKDMLRRIFAALCAIILIVIVIPSHFAHAASTWYVSINGNDSNSCLTIDLPCRTIQAAFNKANDFDQINIGLGTYKENLLLSKPMNISGQNSLTTIIDGGGIGPVIHITGNGVSISNVTIQNGKSGIITEPGGWIRLNNSLVTRNTAQEGAGILNYGKVDVWHTIFSYNTANVHGGAIVHSGSDFSLSYSAIVYNTAPTAAAIYQYNSDSWYMSVSNTTISNNIVTSAEGGVVVNNSPMEILFLYSTLYHNSQGYSILNLQQKVDFQATILVSLNTTNCKPGSSMKSFGYNIANDSSCGLVHYTDRSNTDPKIGALADNGGDTLTHALQPDSPAIDADLRIPCTSSVEDQRGIRRPQGKGCDSGAFEYERNFKPIVIWIHGYQGFTQKQISSEQGITKYDPSKAKDEVYVDMIDWIHNDGFDVWIAHYDSGPEGTPTAYFNATRLAKQLDYVRQQEPGSPLILVAHSLGGLVARAYLETGRYKTSDIKALVTLGSPHKGVSNNTFVLTLCRLIPSLKKGCNPNTQFALLEALSIATFNDNYNKRTEGVDYYVLNGKVDSSNLNAQGRLFSQFIPGDDDALIQTDSGIGLKDVKVSLVTKEVHSTDFGLKSYYNNPISESYTRCIQPLIQSANCTAASIQEFTPTRELTSELNTLLPPVEGDITAHQVVTKEIIIEGGTTLFNTSWTTGTTMFTLKSPSGILIDPSYAALHPTEVTYSTSDSDSDVPLTNYLVNNAESGKWQMILAGGGELTTVHYVMTALLQSQAVPVVTLSQSTVSVGSVVTANVAVSNTLTISKTTFYVTKPNGSKFSTAIGSLHADMHGFYIVEVTVEGLTSSGKPFQRYTVVSFEAVTRNYLPLISR